jgi:DNA-binding MurR/RpiR family transcriptional regulator
MSLHGNVLLKIREMKDSLPPVMGRVADYVLANTDEIPHLSIKNLAIASGTSDASVLRFCKMLGFESYRSFIVTVSASLGSMEEESRNDYADIQPGDDLSAIVTTIARNNVKSIEDTMSVLDRKQIERAVQKLIRCQRIVFFGITASGLVCMDAAQKFTRINKICHACTDGHSMLTAAALLSRNDAAVFVSNSGSTAEILDALDVAKRTGACIIAITKYHKSALASNADIVLHISTPELSIRSGAMGSRIAMLTVIDMLFAGVASAEYKNVKKYLTKTHQVLANKHRK